MPQVFRTAQANDDLLEIWLHIHESRPAAADRLLDRIDHACTLLAQFPNFGESRPELGPNVRAMRVSSYVVFYRPAANGIDVLRVLHGRRDASALMGPDG